LQDVDYQSNETETIKKKKQASYDFALVNTDDVYMAAAPRYEEWPTLTQQ
jgi:hypothetical protein